MAGRKRGRKRPNRCGLELGTILNKFKGDFGSVLGPKPLRFFLKPLFSQPLKSLSAKTSYPVSDGTFAYTLGYTLLEKAL